VTVNSLHPATYMPTKMVLREIGHQGKYVRARATPVDVRDRLTIARSQRLAFGAVVVRIFDASLLGRD
jgi:hypothetical protein